MRLRRTRQRAGADDITTVEGIPALSLDAISSVAYGPEAMLVVLATAGAGALSKITPITVVIVALLILLVFSYRQVIEAYPEGGGSYDVCKDNLGQGASRIAAAALIVDYVLTVSVSIAAGVGALVSAFSGLAPYRLGVGIGILAFITALNLWGLATSARTFLLPTGVFVAGIYIVIVSGLLRSGPAASAHLPPHAVSGAAATVGVLLLLKAFALGCSGLTGVEAIANDVPAFREPRVRRAQRTQVLLGAILGTMLLGLAVLTVRFHIEPSANQTVLSQIMGASIGRGSLYYVFDLSTTVVLVLAANTSFGALPNLARLLARDNLVPHPFGLEGSRRVYRVGVLSLAVAAALLLVAVNGDTEALIPMFAVGVFTGVTLSQSGLVRHWQRDRGPGWWPKALLNGTGAAMTAVASCILLVTRFTEGAWVVVIVIPTLMVLFWRVASYYRLAGEVLELGAIPVRPAREETLVIVPIHTVSRVIEEALTWALSLGDEVVAVSVQFDDDAAAALQVAWDEWEPGVPLVVLHSDQRSLVGPMLSFVASEEVRAHRRVVVLIAELKPHQWRHQILQNQRGVRLATVLRQRTDVVVARFQFRVPDWPSRSWWRRRWRRGDRAEGEPSTQPNECDTDGLG